MNSTNQIVASNDTTFCDLKEFSENYRSIHGTLSVLVCVFGSIANILNICVLTRKEMRIPTNFILTGLAVADLMVMLEYIPFSAHGYLDPDARHYFQYFSYPWALYIWFHALFAQVCHFISCCLTVMLAVWRYIAITLPQNNKIWCSPYRTKLFIALAYIFCPFVCAPLFVALHIEEYERSIYTNGTIIPFKESLIYVGEKYNATLYITDFKGNYWHITLWLYGVVIKLLPCVLLTILSSLLIKALLDGKKRYKDLCKNSGLPLVDGTSKKQRTIEKEQQVDRTTRMLLTVLLLFLLTEIPQAILGLLSVLLRNEFYKSCYGPMGELMDIIALTNSAINFILYCSMSQQFRSAFHKFFTPTCIINWMETHRTTESDKISHITQV